MHYWLFIIPLLPALLIIAGIVNSRNLKKKKLAEIRKHWGQPKTGNRNFNLLNACLTTYGGAGNISAATAADLDIDGIFEFIDRTSSKPGQQYLYKQLHSPQISDIYFSALEQKITQATANETLRELTELKLSELNNDDAGYLPGLFEKTHQSIFTPLLTFYIGIAPFITPGFFISLFIVPNQFVLLLVFALLIANVIIHYGNKTKMISYTHSLPQLLTLTNVATWLAANDLLNNDQQTGASLAGLTRLKKSLSFISLQNKTSMDPTDLAYLVTEWFKMFLLIEPLVFVSSINKVNKYLNDIKLVYEAVAQVDMAISIQSVRAGAAYYCKPSLITGSEKMMIKDLYHPLIVNCVPNSISIDNKQGVLITGSNMSGKTTFIRAIAVNALLSQTINTSFAAAYTAPPLKIFTSIDISDDMGGSKSYFQAEALSVKNIILQSAAGKPANSLVIIDEIFRGTNTIERIAAAKAVLSYFIENNSFIFVSTHDLELAELLGNDYKAFSFEELAGDNRLLFDYKIKQGLLKTRNGIAVLKGLDFPQSIINEANKVSTQLRDKYDLE